ncbi:CoA-binding protein [Raineya orbicola]|jgi:predicted CoA-binding protein|uniref:Putative CoA-binding protein n=1 Tax=Raineya orbicola TaxID=2016530 RepID=A0A2N3IAR6_9BACT|nr:CoA-binding protein [Raineya orbicola]PKQ67464.1 putative CoA-binding protein [Raineya orbicola]
MIVEIPKTLILGATPNPERYAYLAAQMLSQKGYPIVLVGIKKGEVFGQKIIQDKTQIFSDIHTITLYVGRANQAEWYDYILQTQPKRLIFNPNTENPELEKLAQNAGIECLHACTLVLLRTGQY